MHSPFLQIFFLSAISSQLFANEDSITYDVAVFEDRPLGLNIGSGLQIQSFQTASKRFTPQVHGLSMISPSYL